MDYLPPGKFVDNFDVLLQVIRLGKLFGVEDREG